MAIVRTVECRVITCARLVFSGKAQAVYARSPEGWFGILPGHAPAAFTLADGPVRVVTEGGERRFDLEGGTLLVDRTGVTILAVGLQAPV